MFTWFKNILFPTVDHILADFHKKVAQLEAHVEKQNELWDHHNTKAIKAANEADRASIAAAKLRSLLD